MSSWARLIMRLYSALLAFYPQEFRASFGEEMQADFESALIETQFPGGEKARQLLWRELRDWPGTFWREHLRSRKRVRMNQNSLSWKPLNTKELLAGLALFVLPIFSPILKLIFGYTTIVNNIGSIFNLTILVISLVIIILGIKNGFPRWSLPYLGVSIITIVMLQMVPPLIELFYLDVQKLVHYSDKTLAARIQYSALLNGFFWLVPFVALILLILILRAWPRTRVLAQRIRQDWTLMSFMIYSALVFKLELIFEEIAYDEAWKIASRICLVVGAWIYFKNADKRKRILALLAGATLFFGIAAVGQWVVLPLQSWGDFYGYDHWTYRQVMLSGTLTDWVSALFCMLLPALLARIPQTKQPDSVSEDTLTPA